VQAQPVKVHFMGLLILFYLWLRRQPAGPGFWRVCSLGWFCGACFALAAGHWPLSLLYFGIVWVYWLIAFEVAGRGWCSRWLLQVLGSTWHGRFDSLASLALCGALLCQGWARAAWCLAYVVASGCRYAARPRPTVAPAAAPLVVPAAMRDVWQAGHAAGVLAGYNAGRTSTPTRPL
jgi:hypothetical protein